MRDELIAAIENDPEDVENYRVYADWLEANGQPRGQLIQMELLRARLTDRAKLEYLRQRIEVSLTVEQDGDAGGVLQLLDELDAPGLRRLALNGLWYGDHIARGLFDTRVGKQLVELAVESCVLTDVAAKHWASHPPPRRLAKLEVRDNRRLSQAGMAALRTIAAEVTE